MVRNVIHGLVLRHKDLPLTEELCVQKKRVKHKSKARENIKNSTVELGFKDFFCHSHFGS